MQALRPRLIYGEQTNSFGTREKISRRLTIDGGTEELIIDDHVSVRLAHVWLQAKTSEIGSCIQWRVGVNGYANGSYRGYGVSISERMGILRYDMGLEIRIVTTTPECEENIRKFAYASHPAFWPIR